VLIGIEPMKKVLTVLRNDLSAITPKYGRHDSNMLYVSYPKGATDQFVIYHLYVLLLSSKGIEPFTALTNSFTENHHYQSDHLPLIFLKIIYFNIIIF
jgi:hypothetical protein